MQDRPSLAQLLEAVSGFLASLSASTATPSPQQMFHARVAGNVMEQVRRELRLAPALNEQEIARLQSLLGQQDTDLLALNKVLCAKIAAGEMTLETPHLREHLIATTLGKLSIDQPNYAGTKRALEDL